MTKKQIIQVNKILQKLSIFFTGVSLGAIIMTLIYIKYGPKVNLESEPTVLSKSGIGLVHTDSIQYEAIAQGSIGVTADDVKINSNDDAPVADKSNEKLTRVLQYTFTEKNSRKILLPVPFIYSKPHVTAVFGSLAKGRTTGPKESEQTTINKIEISGAELGVKDVNDVFGIRGFSDNVSNWSINQRWLESAAADKLTDNTPLTSNSRIAISKTEPNNFYEKLGINFIKSWCSSKYTDEIVLKCTISTESLAKLTVEEQKLVMESCSCDSNEGLYEKYKKGYININGKTKKT